MNHSSLRLDEGIEELEEVLKRRNQYEYIQDRELFEEYTSIRNRITKRYQIERLENEHPLYLQLVKEL